MSLISRVTVAMLALSLLTGVASALLDTDQTSVAPAPAARVPALAPVPLFLGVVDAPARELERLTTPIATAAANAPAEAVEAEVAFAIAAILTETRRLPGALGPVEEAVAPAPAPASRGTSVESAGTPAPTAAPDTIPTETAALVLATSAAVAFGWAAGWFAGAANSLKRLVGLGGVAGFTRLTRDDVLGHTAREQLFATVQETPGLTLKGLVDAASLGRTAVTYHLRVLEREGLVASIKDGRRRVYYPRAGNGSADAVARAHLNHSTARAVADRVLADPGTDQKALCEALGLRPSLAHWHADRLGVAGLVRKERDGRHVRYYPEPLLGRLGLEP